MNGCYGSQLDGPCRKGHSSWQMLGFGGGVYHVEFALYIMDGLKSVAFDYKIPSHAKGAQKSIYHTVLRSSSSNLA